MGPNRRENPREDDSISTPSQHTQRQHQPHQQVHGVAAVPVCSPGTTLPQGSSMSVLTTLPAAARPASPNNVSWFGTGEAAPLSVLSCQKLEASLQLQSMRTIQTIPAPFTSKFDCEGRPLPDIANRVNFLNQDGALSREFCQFGIDSEPQNYYHRQAPQDNAFGHLNEASLETQVPNFLSQPATEPSYQHQQSQLSTENTVIRQQNSGFSSAPPLYRQSHLSADAPPFCHQTQQPEQSTFQPPIGTPAYLQSQPAIETILYHHQNQLPIEPPMFQRSAEGQVYHQTTNQSGPESTLYHQNQSNIETPVYHAPNQRPGDSSTFREHHPVQEGQIFHQTLSAVEAALYRNHHSSEASLFHQPSQTGSEPSLYHSNQQASESSVYHRQEAAMYHHPTPPPHFVHQNQASGPQAASFYHQNQAVSESNSFYRFPNQAGDSHFQRPTQPNTAFFHLQNQTEAQYHQQNSSDSSFHLLPNQRTAETQLHSSSHLDAPFYSHRNLEVDHQLCQQTHSAVEAQLFQFQNQAAQDNQLHHQNQSVSVAEVSSFSYPGQVTQDNRVQQPNHGPVELPIASFTNQSSQEPHLRNQRHSEVPVYHYQGQVPQDLRQQNPNGSELSVFHYQNQATQGAQFNHTNVAVSKSSAVYQQKLAVGEAKIPQNMVSSLTKPSQNWEAAERNSHKVVALESSKLVNLNGSQFPCLPVSFAPKGPPMVTGQFHQNLGGTEKVNAYRQTGNGSEPNASVKSPKEIAARLHNLSRGNQNNSETEKGIEEISESQKDIEGIHLDHNRNTLKLNSSHRSYDEVKGTEDRSKLYSNGFHSFSSHESVKASEDFSNLEVEECNVLKQNLDNLNVQTFEGDKNLDLNQRPNSRTDEEKSSQCGSGNSSSMSDGCGWPTQVQSIAEVNQIEEQELVGECEVSELVNTEESFSVSNAHLLPRPPDILLTLPADVESAKECAVVEPAIGSAIQPVAPSNQLSQDGSEEFGPALEFLFDRPEDIELPPTPPPTPPMSPPLVTPPCSPPLSSSPSSPRSSTPPFSSPLSSSPHVGDGEMQSCQAAHWEPFKIQAQSRFNLTAVESLSVSKEKETGVQSTASFSSDQLDESHLPGDKTNAQLDSILPEQVKTSSAESVSQPERSDTATETHCLAEKNEAASSSRCFDKEETQTSQQLWNPILGSTTCSHQQDEELSIDSTLPQDNLGEESSTLCPLPKCMLQSGSENKDMECEDGEEMRNPDFCKADTNAASGACISINPLDVENSSYFLPIQDEVSLPTAEANDDHLSNSVDTEPVSSLEPAQASQDSSPSPSSMVINGCHSPRAHCLRL